MRNITEKQRELIAKLREIDPELVVRWDETRGVAGSIRGKLWLGTEGQGPGAGEANPEAVLDGFLSVYGALFGPTDLSMNSFKKLRSKNDDIGWTHLVFMHILQQEDIIGASRREGLEVYGAKLAAHFDQASMLTEVQSSLWRDINIDVDVRINPGELVNLAIQKIENLQGFAELRKRMEKEDEKDFPLTDPPHLVVYPWKGRFPLVWVTYGYSAYDKDTDGRPKDVAGITFGKIFVDAKTGEIILFAPALKTVETPDTGSGLAVTPLTGTHTTRPLNIVRVDATSTYRLKDTTLNRDIVTYDAACSASYNSALEIETAIKNGTLPVSEDTDGDRTWNRLPTNTTEAQRTSGQQPEVDAHYFARQQYDWYNAVSGGRDGWDDGNYANPPVPPQTINVLAHCRMVDLYGGLCTDNNAYKNWRKSGGIWTTWLAFMDSDSTTYDYIVGSHFIFAHEYQHAITDFTFEDGAGDPGLDYSSWLGAVHEGLSDVFGVLTTEQWLPGRDISLASPPQVFRNIVYPRDTAAHSANKNDHFGDKDIRTSYYERGTILAHCAYLMGKGGVHQRNVRTPALIPVYSLGRQTVGGKDVTKAARIWYRALSYYFSTHGALIGLPANDENSFRTLRDGCVSAAIDLYGSGSAEHLNTILAFYAVGLHPATASYGADITFLRWGVSWDLSRNYIGLTCGNYQSLDLFVNNGGTSEWNALINVVDPSTGNPTQYENTVYCRVRNVGDQAANNVQVQFYYAKAGTALWTWLPVTDKDGTVQTLNVGTLTAGLSNFPDSDQNTPPASASIKWYIPPLAAGETVNHFCLKAVATASNDVNPHNNEVQSNIAYTAYSPASPAKATFVAGNPFQDKKIPIALKLEAVLPESWKAVIEEDFNRVYLKPEETRPFTVRVHMPPEADARLELPLDGNLDGHLYGDVAGRFIGSLSDIVLDGFGIRGHFASQLPHVGSLVGKFTGIIDLSTGQVKGKVIGRYPCANIDKLVCVGVEACLRPSRRVDISQWDGTELIGGVTLQIQVPLKHGPCAHELPPTNTRVTPELKPTPPSSEPVNGKVVRILYNSCGDFMGFVLSLCPGERTFLTRDPGLRRLVIEACEHQWTITVVPSEEEPIGIARIEVHC
jgi:Zn-dependent metalloprotease